MVDGWMVPRHEPLPSALSHEPWTQARIPHASFRIRMPRLRNTVRVSDARGPDAVVSGLPRCRPAEAALGLRRAVGQPSQVVQVAATRAVRIVRGSAWSGGVSHQLRIKNSSHART